MKTVLEVRTESHHFRNRDIIGGDPALDFVNTVTGRDQSPHDWIDSYPRLLEWAAFVHLLPKRVLRADRKSTCLNSSHRTISYAVFCLKKKKKLLLILLTIICAHDPVSYVAPLSTV